MVKKPRKRRNWSAVSAHFRTSSGPMKDRKKEEDKYKCRENSSDWIDFSGSIDYTYTISNKRGDE